MSGFVDRLWEWQRNEFELVMDYWYIWFAIIAMIVVYFYKKYKKKHSEDEE